MLAEPWPEAKHQLCVFHALMDLTAKVLDAVRRMRRACERRGKAGRKPKRGRPSKGARRRARGATCKQKAAAVFKRRYLAVKRAESLSEREREDLETMLGYLPELRTLWGFSQEVYKAWGAGQSLKVARWRWTRLSDDPEYQGVPELKEALEGLGKGRLERTLSFLGLPPSGGRRRTIMWRG